MVDITYPLYPIFAFLGLFLVLVPLPWHIKARNSGTCFYILWASLACLNQFVNSVLWHGNVLDRAPVWCDISIRIMMGASVGLPASSLCINRRLYHIIASNKTSVTGNKRGRTIVVDSLICGLFPLIYIVLQQVVQGHRFDIFEDIGCFPALYNTLPTYFISLMWPLAIGCVSGCYCVLTIRAFVRRQIEFASILTAYPSITPWRYFRLMALAMTDLLLTMPLAIFAIWLNATSTPIQPWRSWSDTHFDYSRVMQYPALIWRRDPKLVASMEFTRWVVPVCALVFFAFFGLAEEATKNYVSLVNKILKRFRLRTRKFDHVSFSLVSTDVTVDPHTLHPGADYDDRARQDNQPLGETSLSRETIFIGAEPLISSQYLSPPYSP